MNLMSLSGKFKVGSFNNYINSTCFLAKSTVDTLSYVNVILVVRRLPSSCSSASIVIFISNISVRNNVVMLRSKTKNKTPTFRLFCKLLSFFISLFQSKCKYREKNRHLTPLKRHVAAASFTFCTPSIIAFTTSTCTHFLVKFSPAQYISVQNNGDPTFLDPSAVESPWEQVADSIYFF